MSEQSQDIRHRLSERLESVRRRMADAALRVDRDPDDVQLVAVTKKQPSSFVDALVDLGVDGIGENRPEEISRKRKELDREIPWHMIGHFQRKKIPKTVEYLDLVHSVHSLELLATLDVHAKKKSDGGPPLGVLLQVNVSGESSKQGFRPDDLYDVADLAEAMTGVELRGLMTMAPFDSSERQLRRIFGELRELRYEIGVERAPELSMGMTRDFEIAIEEGATIVRIGTALFEGVQERS